MYVIVQRDTPRRRRKSSDDAETQSLLQQLKQELHEEKMARKEAERQRYALQKQLEAQGLVADRQDDKRGRRDDGAAQPRGGHAEGPGDERRSSKGAAPRRMSDPAYAEANTTERSLERYTQQELEEKLYELKEELSEKDICLRAERKGTAAARKFKEGAVSLIEKAQRREAEVEDTRRQLQELLRADRDAWCIQEKKSEQNMLLLRKEIFQLTNALYIERRSNQRLAEQLLREQEMKDYAVKFISKRAKQTARTDNPLMWFKK